MSMTWHDMMSLIYISKIKKSQWLLKIRSKRWIFFTLTNYKSKVQVSDSTINYFVWVQKEMQQAIVIGQKSYSTFKSASYWPKKRSARPSTQTIAPLKRGVKVLDPLLPSSWPVTFVKLDRELFLKQIMSIYS